MQHINLVLPPDKTIFFTSDTHFGHRNIISFCARPFADVKEMSKKMIEYWNSVVGPDDIVFHLGDVCWFTDRHGTARCLGALNGHKYIVPGNHDKPERQFELCDERVSVCSDITVLHVRPEDPSDPRFERSVYEIMLSHYPLLCYSHSQQPQCYQFFGHIHTLAGSAMQEFDKPLPNKRRQLDVGCDRHGYKPVGMFELFAECEVVNADKGELPEPPKSRTNSVI